MSASEIRAHYEELNTIAQRFQRRAETTEQTLQTIERSMNKIRASWQGRGSEAFFQEMSQLVVPGMRRLNAALQQAARVTSTAANTLLTAEEEAARLFRDESNSDVILAKDGDGGMGGGGLENGSGDGGNTEEPPEDKPFGGANLNPVPGGAPPDPGLIDRILSLDFPWWVDTALGFLAVGDVIDLVREQIIKRITGGEPDALVTALAGFGLIADLGWLQPVPSAEDAPNAILAALKTIAKNLPTGEARDRLAEMVEQALKNPDDLMRLGRLTEAFASNPQVFQRMLDNPNAMMAALEGGADTVNLIARHGEDAFQAAHLLGKHAPDYLRFYDDMAQIPGAQNLLRDLGSGSSTTFGAMGELYYFHSIRGELAEVGLTRNGLKSADGLLRDGTVIDVKNYNFASGYYQSPTNVQRAITSMEQQVALRRTEFPGQPIRYVFTTPEAEVPTAIVDRLRAIGVDVRFMGLGYQ